MRKKARALPAFAAIAAACFALPAFASAQRVVSITGTNYVFLAPDTITAGLTTFEFHNTSTEGHEAILKRVPDGHTAREAIAMLVTRQSPEWLESAGGPNVTDPGVTSRTMQLLAPGTYIWMCVLSAPDKLTHSEKGMTRVMIVKKAPRASTAAVSYPATHASIDLNDFAFVIKPRIERGAKWISVNNTGRTPHEIVIFRMNDGKKLADLKQWQKDKVGLQPFTRIGGLAAISAREHALIRFDGEPGTYVFRCRVMDSATGKTHVQLGMEQEVTIE